MMDDTELPKGSRFLLKFYRQWLWYSFICFGASTFTLIPSLIFTDNEKGAVQIMLMIEIGLNVFSLITLNWVWNISLESMWSQFWHFCILLMSQFIMKCASLSVAVGYAPAKESSSITELACWGALYIQSCSYFLAMTLTLLIFSFTRAKLLEDLLDLLSEIGVLPNNSRFANYSEAAYPSTFFLKGTVYHFTVVCIPVLVIYGVYLVSEEENEALAELQFADLLAGVGALFLFVWTFLAELIQLQPMKLRKLYILDIAFVATCSLYRISNIFTLRNTSNSSTFQLNVIWIMMLISNLLYWIIMGFIFEYFCFCAKTSRIEGILWGKPLGNIRGYYEGSSAITMVGHYWWGPNAFNVILAPVCYILMYTIDGLTEGDVARAFISAFFFGLFRALLKGISVYTLRLGSPLFHTFGCKLRLNNTALLVLLWAEIICLLVTGRSKHNQIQATGITVGVLLFLVSTMMQLKHTENIQQGESYYQNFAKRYFDMARMSMQDEDPAGYNQNIYEILIPEGVNPGDCFDTLVGTGLHITMICPENRRGGDRIRFWYTNDDSEAPQADLSQAHEVAIPEGVQPGTAFSTVLENGNLVWLNCPPDRAAGDVIIFVERPDVESLEGIPEVVESTDGRQSTSQTVEETDTGSGGGGVNSDIVSADHVVVNIGWTCPECTNVNESGNTVCDICYSVNMAWPQCSSPNNPGNIVCDNCRSVLLTTQVFTVVGSHGARIKESPDLNSAEILLLETGAMVEVTAPEPRFASHPLITSGRRLRVIQPVQGYASRYSSDGYQLLSSKMRVVGSAGARVKQTPDLGSAVVGLVATGLEVEIAPVEQQWMAYPLVQSGRRMHIVSPLEGYVSRFTESGTSIIDPLNDEEDIPTYSMSLEREISRDRPTFVRRLDDNHQVHWTRLTPEMEEEVIANLDSTIRLSSIRISQRQNSRRGGLFGFRLGSVQVIQLEPGPWLRKINYHNGQIKWLQGRAIDNAPAETPPNVSREDVANVSRRNFKGKREWFLHEIAKLYVGRQAVPVQMIRVNVSRDNIIEDAMRIFENIPANDLRKLFRFNFQGEAGEDTGGVAREFWSVCTEALFNPSQGYWKYSQTDNLSYNIDGSIIQSHTNWKRILHFMGRFIGKAIFDQQILPIYLARPLYKHLLGVPVAFDDLEFVEKSVHDSMTWMIEHKNVDALYLDFTIMMPGESSPIELKSGGAEIEVTDSNKQEYIRLYTEYVMFNSNYSQALGQLLTGFYEVIPPGLLSVFDFQELELLMCGVPEINVEDWKQNTVYTGSLTRTHRLTKWFWQVITEFNNEKRSKLLQFVTGTSRVPAGGFKNLQGNDGEKRQFTLMGLTDRNQRYPIAHTCFNRLDLPKYDNKVQLQTDLDMVIQIDVTGFSIS